MLHMGVIKSGMLLPLGLQQPSRCRITSSSATNLRVDGKRYAMGAVEVSNTCFGQLVSNSFRHHYWEIYSWDLSNYHYCPLKQQQDCNFQYLIKPPLTKFPRILRPSVEEVLNCKYYLIVDESTKTLMMIRLQIYYQDYEEDEVEYKSYNHDVHRLDFDRLEWFHALVDIALFIGRNNGSVIDVQKFPRMMLPGYIYLACNFDNFFQLTGLCMLGGEYAFQNFVILSAEMTNEDLTAITSFPVWNFG